MKKRVLIAVAALAVFAPKLNAYDEPSLKEGLWSVHSIMTSKPDNKVIDGHYSICRNHAFDQHNRQMEADVSKRPGCTMLSDDMQGNARTVAMTCQVGSTRIESKTTTTFTGDSKVHNESHSTYTPAMRGMEAQTMVMDWSYSGACPAGVQPGDRVNQDGTVMHLWKH